MVSGQCTNKNCIFRSSSKTPAKQSASRKKDTASKSSVDKKEPKTTRIKRASKCITYNLNDIKEEAIE